MTLSVLEAIDYDIADSFGNITKITADRLWFTKTFNQKGKINASNARYFKLKDVFRPKSLQEAYSYLLVLENNPKAFAIRFEYINASVGDVVQRKGELLDQHGVTNLISIDVDRLELPSNISPTDIAEQGKYVLSLLPKEWFPDDAGFIAQASSSAALPYHNSIKLHMWFWNADGISISQMKGALSTCSIVDPALYSVGQPHYTARPLFVGGKSDPFCSIPRTVLVSGKSVKIPKDIQAYKPAIKVTDKDLETYTKSIIGGLKKSKQLEHCLEIVKNWDINTDGLRTKVISAFHQGIQDCYNLQLLEQEITEYLEVLRPGLAKDYIAQGRNAAVSNIIKLSSRSLEDKINGEALPKIDGGKHARFLDIKDNFPKNTLTFLKASLGSGKTHTIEKALQTGKINGRFLAITDTSALVESNAKRFNAIDFRDRDLLSEFYAGKVERLSGTIHSLQLLEENTKPFDFVFIDEADSVLNTLLFASIIEEGKRGKLIEVLADILKRATKVVLSDGDLSQETLECYFTLIEGSKKVAKIEHARKNLNKVPAHRHISPTSLWGALFAELSAGKKCLLVSDCSPDSLNLYYKMLEREMPTKHIEVVHATSKMDPKVRDIVNNTTDALKRHTIDALLCSPSITNGVDFNYFDTVFVLTTSENHSPNMRFQALMRERQPKEIHFYCKPLRGYETGYSSLSVDKGWISTSRKKLALRKEREYKAYSSTFNYYLVQAGCRIITVNKPCECPLTQEDTDAFEIERAMAIITANELHSAKRHDDAYEMQKMIKAMLGIEELNIKTVLSFLEFKWHKKMEFLSKVIDDYWHVLKKNDPAALRTELKKSGHKFHLLSSVSLKSNNAKTILAKCGILDDITETARMYVRYCNHTGLKISEQIKDSMEVILELKH